MGISLTDFNPSVALFNDVGVKFEKGGDLFARGDLFPIDYSAPGLVYDSGQQIERPLQLLRQIPAWRFPDGH